MALDSAVRDFERLVAVLEPRLRRAFLGVVGPDRMPDALSEAFAYCWEHWERVSAMSSPPGYLFRVGQSKTRLRKRPRLDDPDPEALPHVEPGLPAALAALSDAQRTAVWLAHGCSWSHAEIAEVLDVSTSTVSTHVNRGLARLRIELGVGSDA